VIVEAVETSGVTAEPITDVSAEPPIVDAEVRADEPGDDLGNRKTPKRTARSGRAKSARPREPKAPKAPSRPRARKSTRGKSAQAADNRT
jgi:hypothetical protein